MDVNETRGISVSIRLHQETKFDIFRFMSTVDISTVTSDMKILDNVMKNISKDFELKDLGASKQYLVIELEKGVDERFTITVHRKDNQY